MSEVTEKVIKQSVVSFLHSKPNTHLDKENKEWSPNELNLTLITKCPIIDVRASF